jgi:glutamate dehydrogenase
MTSLSVRQYILGVLKAHGLKEKDVTKVSRGRRLGHCSCADLCSFKLVALTVILGLVSYSLRYGLIENQYS